MTNLCDKYRDIVKGEIEIINDEIEQFYQTFAPMLDGFQKVYLREIVERLKAIK